MTFPTPKSPHQCEDYRCYRKKYKNKDYCLEHYNETVRYPRNLLISLLMLAALIFILGKF
jgi:hypothetical protein